MATWLCAGSLLHEVESTAHFRRHTQNSEEVGRDARSRDALRFAQASAVQADVFKSGDALEDMLLPYPLLEIYVSRGNALADDRAERGIFLPNHHYPIGIAERKLVQQHRVDHAEDGSVGADAKRQDDDYDDVEDRRLANEPQTKADVPGERVHGYSNYR